MDNNITPADLYAMTPARRTYWRRKLAGLCPMCGKAPPWGGKNLCAKCQCKVAAWKARYDPDGAKHRASAKARAERLRAMGLCVDCTRPVRPGSTRCEACLKRMREWGRKNKRSATPGREVET